MRLSLNGEEKRFPNDVTVAALLELEGEPVHHVVVEVNGEYVSRAEYASRKLADGDRVETILPAFGG